MERLKYYSLNKYLQDRFGFKVYKVSLNGGFTCPNRDGTIGHGGCVFCSGMGSGDFSSESTLSIGDQLEEGKRRIAGKLPKNQRVGYIAYFQAFTNTYAPVEILERKYMEAIEDPDVVILSVATRPDCISNEVLELLKRINKIKPVWIELGLQTIHEKSIAYIRRGYGNDVYVDALKRLRAAGIEVVTHVILGLPGETKEMMLDTVRFVTTSGANGIKLQLLHVLKGTDLCTDYENGFFETMSMEEYIDLVCDCIRIIPKEMVIHRLTGDGARKYLVAPLWSLDKKKVLNEFNRKIEAVSFE